LGRTTGEAQKKPSKGKKKRSSKKIKKKPEGKKKLKARR